MQSDSSIVMGPALVSTGCRPAYTNCIMHNGHMCTIYFCLHLESGPLAVSKYDLHVALKQREDNNICDNAANSIGYSTLLYSSPMYSIPIRHILQWS